MPISTVPVTGSVLPPDGSTLAAGEVVFTLSAPDTEDGIVIARETIATLDEGALPDGFELWRNTAGIRGTYYKVDLRAIINQGTNGDGQTIYTRKVYRLGLVQVGDDASFTLADLLDNPVPDEPGWNVNLDPGEYAALQAQLDAVDDLKEVRRSELVTRCATGWRARAGQTYTADGLDYVGSTGATTISDLPGLLPLGFVAPDHFGAKNRAAISAAATYWASLNTTGNSADWPASTAIALVFVSGTYTASNGTDGTPLVITTAGAGSRIEWRNGARTLGVSIHVQRKRVRILDPVMDGDGFEMDFGIKFEPESGLGFRNGTVINPIIQNIRKSDYTAKGIMATGNATHLEIVGGIIEGCDYNLWSTKALTTDSTGGFLATGVHFIGARRNNVFYGSGGEVKLTNCRIRGADREGVLVEGGSDFSALEHYFDGCTITGNHTDLTARESYTITGVTDNGGFARFAISGSHKLWVGLRNVRIQGTGIAGYDSNTNVRVTGLGTGYVDTNLAYVSDATGSFVHCGWDVRMYSETGTVSEVNDIFFNGGNINSLGVFDALNVTFNGTRLKVNAWMSNVQRVLRTGALRGREDDSFDDMPITGTNVGVYEFGVAVGEGADRNTVGALTMRTPQSSEALVGNRPALYHSVAVHPANGPTANGAPITVGFASRAAFVTWVAAGNKPIAGLQYEAGSERYRAQTGATAISDLPGFVPAGDWTPDHFQDNTTPGTTNMRAAIVAANTAAAAAGVPLILPFGRTYAVQKVSGSPMVATTSWLGGGTIIAIGTATNVDLLRTGAAGLTFAVRLDNGAQLGSAFQNMHDRTTIMPGFEAGNSAFQGIRSMDRDDFRILGARVWDTVNKAVLIKADLKNVKGLFIRGLVIDTRTLGLGNTNGGLSIQGTEDDPATFTNDPDEITYWVENPDVDVVAYGIEDPGWGTTGVGVEMRRGIRGGRFNATTYGFRIGISFNDCFGSLLTFAIHGADEDGLEFRGGRYSTAIGSVYEGATEAPAFGVRVSLGIGHTVDGNFVCRSGEGEDASNQNGAPVFLNGSTDCVVRGTGRRLNGGKHYLLNRGSKDCRVSVKFIPPASGTVDQAVTLDDRVLPSGDDGITVGGAGTCDGLILDGSDFPETTNAFKGFLASTITGVKLLNGTRIRNTATDSIGAVLASFQIDRSSSLQTYPGAQFPTARPIISADFLDYQSNDGPSRYIAHISGGSPENLMDAQKGSIVVDTTNARMFIKGDGADDDEGWRVLAERNVVTDSANAAQTITLAAKGPELRSTGTLTADRNWRLSASGAPKGARWRITRTGAGAFNLNILDNASGTTLKALATNTWADFVFDGTNWLPSAYGAL